MKQFVRVLYDINCTWTGTTPVYRVYVDDELFTERTWKWTNEYLEEMLQIEAEPGEYLITYELLDPTSATLHVNNMRVDHGPGRVNNNVLRITK
jgi:hypothetical protein